MLDISNVKSRAPLSIGMFERQMGHDMKIGAVFLKGQIFESKALTNEDMDLIRALVKAIPSGFPPQQCFHNSQYLMFLNRFLFPEIVDRLQYIEGYVLSDEWLLPIHHGWLLLDGEKLIDLTLTQELYTNDIPHLRNRILGEIPKNMVYLGLPIDTNDIFERISQAGETHTILDDFNREFAHIKKKYLPNRLEMRQLRKGEYRSNGEDNLQEMGCMESFEKLRGAFELDVPKIARQFAENLLDIVGNLPNPNITATLWDNSIIDKLHLPKKPTIDNVATMLVERLEFSTNSESDLRDTADMVVKIHKLDHALPPYLGMNVVETIEKPFYFVHFTTPTYISLIMSEGFVGRQNLARLYSTRVWKEKQLAKDGYVFAYKIPNVSSIEDAVYVVETMLDEYHSVMDDYDDMPFKASNVHGVVGKASHGLEIFHRMDMEQQIIIPAMCIDNASLISGESAFEMFEDNSEFFEV